MLLLDRVHELIEACIRCLVVLVLLSMQVSKIAFVFLLPALRDVDVHMEFAKALLTVRQCFRWQLLHDRLDLVLQPRGLLLLYVHPLVS